MSKNNSLDPRVNRIDLPENKGDFALGDELDQWQTYEVFVQLKRGMQHTHTGSLHAPNPELAIVMAKEQFGRREQCSNIWVVKTAAVYATSYEDADMFQHAFDKNYREGDGYRTKVTIETFKRELFAFLDGDQKSKTDSGEGEGDYREVKLKSAPGKKRKVIVRK